jgi:hypothetical protein
VTFETSGARILMFSAYVAGASQSFGAEGAVALRTLFDAVRLLLAARPPELLVAPLTVLVPVGEGDADRIIAAHGTPSPLASADAVAHFIARRPDRGCLVAVAADGTYRVVNLMAPVDRAAIAEAVYHREGDVERIVAGTNDNAVPRVSTIAASNFAGPTFSSLDEALDRYGQQARESACEVLKRVWEGGVDGPRIVLVNRPESVMRDSLYQALSTGLRHVDVTREHTTDASKPVDIHVSWRSSLAEALIEVKWLGRSLAQSKGGIGYTEYSASRAQEGANQLADYLDRKRSSSANHLVLGYLVVFDARRRALTGPEDRLAKADALHFEHHELVFHPDHAQLRTDFKEPRRWFLRPRESCFLEAA